MATPVRGHVAGQPRPVGAEDDVLERRPATTTLLTRMAGAFPGVTNVAVFGQTEMSPVTCALSGEDAPSWR